MDNKTMDSDLYTRYTAEDRNEMREWIREHYHFGKADISDYMVFAFLAMRERGENLHLWK